MIYMNFKNYDEFKELFGVQEHGNGCKSRRNKILLSLYKSKELLHHYASERVRIEPEQHYGYNAKRGDYDLYSRFYSLSRDRISSLYRSYDMASLYLHVARLLSSQNGNRSVLNDVSFASAKYKIDDFDGICEDKDTRSVRYYNIERQRVFKMKAGKFMRNIIEEHENVDKILPEQVKIWFCEEFAERWKAYAATQIGSEYELHVNANFEDIYDGSCCIGDFGSCMTNADTWTFYRDYVDAKAAYLTDKYENIVARCIIYTDVETEDGRTLRLAERQYASEGDETLKRQLVMALIAAGEIDGYKKVGADCHSPRSFVDLNGNPFENARFTIRCTLDYEDTVSYQDSFKWYDINRHEAYNWSKHCDCLDLAITEGELENPHDDEVWSDYEGEYIDRDCAIYAEHRNEYVHENSACYCVNTETYECCADCIIIGYKYYYAGRNCQRPADYDVYQCSYCGDWFYASDGNYYSELTGEDYCCEDCRDRAEADYKASNWVYSDFDDEYYPDSVIKALIWNERRNRWDDTTIHEDTLDALIEHGEATYIDGEAYIDDIGYDGEPVHFAAMNLVAA